ncbi:hypothetical protein [Nocardiopsis sp. CC223A]|uniref:hypothetical protein n=1 Tax=Nocardiopsis sp. CC223A TaxID=3044051 RepID=UPI00278BEE43|nr:hypothetical protein [Nocardiopsis sp. CC223A]
MTTEPAEPTGLTGTPGVPPPRPRPNLDPTLLMLDDLIHRRWVLTLEPTPDGDTEVVAYRPIGWTGPGDPHERLAAPDHAALRDLLTRRHTTDHPAEAREQTMDTPGYDPAQDPIPDDLTDEEKNAVRRQGETIATQRALGAPLIGDPNRKYAHGD